MQLKYKYYKSKRRDSFSGGYAIWRVSDSGGWQEYEEDSIRTWGQGRTGDTGLSLRSMGFIKIPKKQLSILKKYLSL